MIRIPLRPLARILDARQKGENPDAIERENKRLRHEDMQAMSRARAEGRFAGFRAFLLLCICCCWSCAWVALPHRIQSSRARRRMVHRSVLHALTLLTVMEICLRPTLIRTRYMHNRFT